MKKQIFYILLLLIGNPNVTISAPAKGGGGVPSGGRIGGGGFAGGSPRTFSSGGGGFGGSSSFGNTGFNAPRSSFGGAPRITGPVYHTRSSEPRVSQPSFRAMVPATRSQPNFGLNPSMPDSSFPKTAMLRSNLQSTNIQNQLLRNNAIQNRIPSNTANLINKPRLKTNQGTGNIASVSPSNLALQTGVAGLAAGAAGFAAGRLSARTGTTPQPVKPTKAPAPTGSALPQRTSGAPLATKISANAGNIANVNNIKKNDPVLAAKINSAVQKAQVDPKAIKQWEGDWHKFNKHHHHFGVFNPVVFADFLFLSPWFLFPFGYYNYYYDNYGPSVCWKSWNWFNYPCYWDYGYAREINLVTYVYEKDFDGAIDRINRRIDELEYEVKAATEEDRLNKIKEEIQELIWLNKDIERIRKQSAISPDLEYAEDSD